MGTAGSPFRVLHCLFGLAPGGVETWLLNLTRAKPENVQFDFLVRRAGGAYENEIKALGANIYLCPDLSRLGRIDDFFGIRRSSAILRRLQRGNRYDAIHVHDYWRAGQTLRLAAEAGFPIRVAHSHDSRHLFPRKTVRGKLRAYIQRHFDRKKILKYATAVAACSREAGLSLIGSAWETDPRCQTIFCGIPTRRFRKEAQENRAEVRARLGIPPDARVIGHVGNDSPVKNQPMVLNAFRQLAGRNPKYHLLMIGKGGQIPAVQRFVEENGLQSRVTLPGVRNDVPAAMIHAMDALIFPSFCEGLPVTAIEAVCAGLYVVCSDTITKDFTETFPNRVEQVPLTEPPAVWADRLEAGIAKRVSCQEGADLVEKSPFSIESSLSSLLSLYTPEL